ncbi:hypothetical protein CA11_15760 [Gimesia maris]|uniref:hypothetical protein n=1 Tax=Gimesia maris TaxID=122 RepID=UPI001189FDFF|nr:hypothetical protein [Gimesia maris]QDU13790.1 hypothetical protein CA11_15760 [Gimesia maris]
MRGLGLKVLAAAMALGISPLLLSAAEPGSGVSDTIQLDPIVRAGTAHLNYDDATRARYHFHNGHWMLETEAGQWLIHQNGVWKRSSPMKDITPTLQMSSYTSQVPAEPGLEPVPEDPPMIESLPDGGVIFRPPPGGNQLAPYFDQFIPSYASTGRGSYGGYGGGCYGGSYYSSYRRW